MKDKLLDRFLFEVKRDAQRAKSRTALSKTVGPEVSVYANPDNWYCTRIVELVLRDLEGTDQSLGFFREERHRINISARRLRPLSGLPGDLQPGVCYPQAKEVSLQSALPGQEFVIGRHWTQTPEEGKVIDSPGEIKAIKELFLELIGEVS